MKSNIDIFIHLLIFEGLSSRAQGTSNRIDLVLEPKDSSCLDPEVLGTLGVTQVVLWPPRLHQEMFRAPVVPRFELGCFQVYFADHVSLTVELSPWPHNDDSQKFRSVFFNVSYSCGLALICGPWLKTIGLSGFMIKQCDGSTTQVLLIFLSQHSW